MRPYFRKRKELFTQTLCTATLQLLTPGKAKIYLFTHQSTFVLFSEFCEYTILELYMYHVGKMYSRA